MKQTSDLTLTPSSSDLEKDWRWWSLVALTHPQAQSLAPRDHLLALSASFRFLAAEDYNHHPPRNALDALDEALTLGVPAAWLVEKAIESDEAQPKKTQKAHPALRIISQRFSGQWMNWSFPKIPHPSEEDFNQDDRVAPWTRNREEAPEDTFSKHKSIVSRELRSDEYPCLGSWVLASPDRHRALSLALHDGWKADTLLPYCYFPTTTVAHGFPLLIAADAGNWLGATLIQSSLPMIGYPEMTDRVLYDVFHERIKRNKDLDGLHAKRFFENTIGVSNPNRVFLASEVSHPKYASSMASSGKTFCLGALLAHAFVNNPDASRSLLAHWTTVFPQLDPEIWPSDPAPLMAVMSTMARTDDVSDEMNVPFRQAWSVLARHSGLSKEKIFREAWRCSTFQNDCWPLAWAAEYTGCSLSLSEAISRLREALVSSRSSFDDVFVVAGWANGMNASDAVQWHALVESIENVSQECPTTLGHRTPASQRETFLSLLSLTETLHHSDQSVSGKASKPRL